MDGRDGRERGYARAGADDRGLGEYFHNALARLPEDQREVLFLRHVIGLSTVEIAGRLDKSSAEIQGLHHRGRRAIKVELALPDAARSRR